MKQEMSTIREPGRDVPVVNECDVCVIGGSCTGVFAAVRAARLGRSVTLIEKTNAFGGVATNGFVNLWHSVMDTEFRQVIIKGLTDEVTTRLSRRNAVALKSNSCSYGFHFNPEELKIELDALVREHGITPMLHTVFSAPVIVDDIVKAVFVENKDGRGAILAKIFIDASGDGDLFARAGVPFTVDRALQPPTACAMIRNFKVAGLDYRAIYDEHCAEFGLEEDSGWDVQALGLPGIHMVAQTHVFGADCSKAGDLTRAEMRGREQIRAIMDMLRKYGPQKDDIALAALPAYIGIRETRRFEAEYCLTEEDVLWGREFEDGIAQGSYRVDVHHPDGGGFLFKYLDGTTDDIRPDGSTKGRWREPLEKNPTFYRIPYRSMVNGSLKNAIMAGRMIAADKGAFGAIRVMVNLNQTGEAAGVAAHLAIKNNVITPAVDSKELRNLLRDGGSVIM